MARAVSLARSPASPPLATSLSGNLGASAVTVYALDTFTEASPPVDILSHTSDVGPAWEAAGAEFYRVIAGGKIEQQFGVLGTIYKNVGVSDCVIRFTLDQFAWGIVARYTDENNFYRIAVQNDNQIDIQKREAGVDTTPVFVGGLSLTFPLTLKVTLNGNVISFEAEGFPGATGSLTDSFNNTATRHGLRTNVEGHTGDNFSIQSA